MMGVVELAAQALGARAAVDPAPLFFILLIIYWIVSTIRGVVRAAQRQAAAARPSAAKIPAQNIGNQVKGSQMKPRARARVAPPPPHVENLPSAPDIESLRFEEAPVTPAGTSEPQTGPPLTIAPLSSPAAITNAIIGMAILGPCAALRSGEHEPMGW